MPAQRTGGNGREEMVRNYGFGSEGRHRQATSLALALPIIVAVFAPPPVPRTSRQEPALENIRLSIQESAPIRLAVLLTVRMPAGCAEPAVAIEYTPGRIDLRLRPRSGECVGAATELDARIDVPLEGIGAGHHVVGVEGQDVGDFWYPVGSPPRMDADARSTPAEISGDIDRPAFIALAERADCADDRNVLWMIDGRLVLWARAARQCADNGYSIVLYEQSPDDETCRFGDSIAGPSRFCRDPSRVQLFDTVIENLDAADLGLGARHRTRRLWAAATLQLLRAQE